MAMQSIESSVNLSSDQRHLYATWEDWDVGVEGDPGPDDDYGEEDEDEDDLDGFSDDRSELFEEWDDDEEDEEEDEDEGDDDDDDEVW